VPSLREFGDTGEVVFTAPSGTFAAPDVSSCRPCRHQRPSVNLLVNGEICRRGSLVTTPCRGMATAGELGAGPDATAPTPTTALGSLGAQCVTDEASSCCTNVSNCKFDDAERMSLSCMSSTFPRARSQTRSWLLCCPQTLARAARSGVALELLTMEAPAGAVSTAICEGDCESDAATGVVYASNGVPLRRCCRLSYTFRCLSPSRFGKTL
jgi:hypothetical protein